MRRRLDRAALAGLGALAIVLSAGPGRAALPEAFTARSRPDLGPRVGQAVPQAALVKIYSEWFRRPYEYMFDRGGKAQPLMVLGRPYGRFMAGIDGIVLYGGMAGALAKYGTVRKRGFYDRTAIEKVAGLKIYRRRSSTLRDFSRFNPKIIRWGMQNLIPDPAATLGQHSFGTIYRAVFSRFFRLMADSYLWLQHGKRQATEQRAYLRAMRKRQFDGLVYLQRRFATALPRYATPGDGTSFSPQMAIGFWLRRGVDGTAPELWRGLRQVLSLYDPAWFRALQLPAGAAKPAKVRRRRKTR